jgi:hypothetical protein
LARCPSAETIAVGLVRGRRLAWCKRSGDGSGKCDLAVGRDGDVAYGIIFKIEESERAALDKAEGLGRGYDLAEVEIAGEFGPVRCLTYLATNTDDQLRPYDWYRNLVMAGALEHGLPGLYVKQIAAVPVIRDPRPQRITRVEAERLLADFILQHPEHRYRLTGVSDDQALA